MASRGRDIGAITRIIAAQRAVRALDDALRALDDAVDGGAKDVLQGMVEVGGAGRSRRYGRLFDDRSSAEAREAPVRGRHDFAVEDEVAALFRAARSFLIGKGPPTSE